jgi:hypothetical protein
VARGAGGGAGRLAAPTRDYRSSGVMTFDLRSDDRLPSGRDMEARRNAALTTARGIIRASRYAPVSNLPDREVVELILFSDGGSPCFLTVVRRVF